MSGVIEIQGPIEIQGLCLRYGAREVLRDVNLSAAAGEVVALIGPNGAGKSTLIRGASGLLKPAAGRVTLDGRPLHGLSPRIRARLVAVVPQAAQFPEAFTVEDTVLLGRTAYLGWVGRESDADRRIARAAMERAAVAPLADRRLGEISGGELQLALIARALAQEAPVLLLDEPTAQLDLRHETRILGMVRDLAHRDRRAVIIALHDLNLAARFADRIGLLGGGRLQALGAPAEVLTAETLSAAYGIPVQVVPHPVLGTPWILAGEEMP